MVFPTDEFKAQGKRFVFVQIDIDQQKAVAQRFSVGPIPDIRFLKNDGTEVGKVIGYKGMALLEDMDKAAGSGK